MVLCVYIRRSAMNGEGKKVLTITALTGLDIHTLWEKKRERELLQNTGHKEKHGAFCFSIMWIYVIFI